HNLRNISAAKEVCKQIGVKGPAFYEAIASFKGAARRLEKLAENDQTVIYKDFAHAPSKVKATTKAFKNQFPDRPLTACLELHTFSSLNQEFLPQYQDALNAADEAIVYSNPKTVEHKRMPMLDAEQLKKAFKRPDLLVFTDSNQMEQHLKQQNWKNRNLLLMSSGNFNNLDLNSLAQSLI